MRFLMTPVLTLAATFAFPFSAKGDHHESHKGMKEQHEKAHLDHDRWMAEHSKWRVEHLKALAMLSQLQAKIFQHEAELEMHNEMIRAHEDHARHHEEEIHSHEESGDEYPNAKIQSATSREEGCIQVGSLAANQLIGIAKVGIIPLIEIRVAKQ